MRRLPLHSPLLLAAAGLLASLSAGCGWTPRDEFLYNRQVVVRAEPGDGSRIASRWSEHRGTATATVPSSVAVAPAD